MRVNATYVPSLFVVATVAFTTLGTSVLMARFISEESAWLMLLPSTVTLFVVYGFSLVGNGSGQGRAWSKSERMLSMMGWVPVLAGAGLQMFFPNGHLQLWALAFCGVYLQILSQISLLARLELR